MRLNLAPFWSVPVSAPVSALRAVWGDDLARLRVSSTKGMHGHLLGATGALEAAITARALHNRQLPPSANCSEPDPDCGIDLVLRPGETAADFEAAISSSFAFGGTNSVLAIRRA